MALLSGGARADVWSSGNLITAAERLEEIRVKEARLDALMAARGLDGIVLTKSRNHAWILAGSDTRVSRGDAGGSVWLLIVRGLPDAPGSPGTATGPSGAASRGKKFLIADNGDSPRIMAEEGLRALGWTERRFPWFAGSAASGDERRRIVDDILPKGRIGCDGPVAGTEDIAGDLTRVRFPLTSTEMRRMRWLGLRAAGAVAGVCREIVPGMRGTEVEGMLSGALARDGVDPVAVLVGSDERLAAWRSPVPTETKRRALATAWKRMRKRATHTSS